MPQSEFYSSNSEYDSNYDLDHIEYNDCCGGIDCPCMGIDCDMGQCILCGWYNSGGGCLREGCNADCSMEYEMCSCDCLRCLQETMYCYCNKDKILIKQGTLEEILYGIIYAQSLWRGWAIRNKFS